MPYLQGHPRRQLIDSAVERGFMEARDRLPEPYAAGSYREFRRTTAPLWLKYGIHPQSRATIRREFARLSNSLLTNSAPSSPRSEKPSASP